ncbi:MAG: quinolinate synthase NadA [Phycisphaeraceae bacterium]|nr:quinolinate synthase NadA [Phycisphaeraceae bacterium]
MLWQPSLPPRYLNLGPDQLAECITLRRNTLGDALVILGHHYQVDDVIRHADHTGDSLKLSQIAARVAAERPVRYVIFCGVHFMAETADMLTPDDVSVILPDLSAGCSMADMAQYDDTEHAWELIHETLRRQGRNPRIIPITYVNSSAAIKAFVGARGGACCTSSNADRVFAWAMNGGDHPDPHDDVRILFLPDQHLGRNTAARFGLDVTRETCLYDPRRTRAGDALGGATPEQLRDARVILWAGHCSVHKLFRPEHCDQVRAADTADPSRPPTTILVHPECAKEVVDKADLTGSTEYILDTLRKAPTGSRWAVGTEIHLVNRIARECADRNVHVRILSDCQCLCTTMYRIDEPHLLWTLDHLCALDPRTGEPTGKPPKPVNVIRVHPEVRKDALLALDRMLRLAPRAQPID